LQAEILWGHFIHAHTAVAYLSDFAWAGDGDLVEPI